MSDTYPKRLTKRNAEPVGIHSDIAPRGMFLFALPFLGIGAYFTLGSLGLIPFDESKVNGPVWLVTAAGLVYALNRLRHAIKFGRTRLRYPRFPLRPGETADLEIELPSAMRQIESAHFELRCIREKYEMRGSGKNRRKQLIQEALYESSQQIEGQTLGAPTANLYVRFVIPEDAPCTAMRGKPPHYWELEMTIKVPGLDLKQRYLLPVYAAVKR